MRATTLVCDASKAKGSTRHVLMVLADHVNHARRDCLVWPSVATIARKCGLSERTVQGCLKELIALGELVVVKKGGGRNYSTLYRINLKTPQNTTGFKDIASKQNVPDGRSETPQNLSLNPADPAPEPEGTEIRTSEAARLAIEHYRGEASKAGWKGLRRVQGERLRKLEAILAEYGLEDWCRAVSSICDNPFYRGENSNGWITNLDYSLKPEKLDRLLENLDYSQVVTADHEEPDRENLN